MLAEYIGQHPPVHASPLHISTTALQQASVDKLAGYHLTVIGSAG